MRFVPRTVQSTYTTKKVRLIVTLCEAKPIEEK